jgi:hypothetical protein
VSAFGAARYLFLGVPFVAPAFGRAFGPGLIESGQICGKGIGGVEVWWVALGVIAKRALVHTTIETMDPKVGAYA